MAVGLVLIASGPAGVLAIASGAILGLGFSFPWSAVASTVLRDIPADERGSAVGILSAFYDLFVGLSSFAAGFVAGHYLLSSCGASSCRQLLSLERGLPGDTYFNILPPFANRNRSRRDPLSLDGATGLR